MALTSIVALLQSALLLLSVAQTSPNLTQNFRDNAAAVAQKAISEATAALSASQTAAVSTSVPPSSQHFTTPSGSVVDGSGNVVSGPTEDPGPPVDPSQLIQYQQFAARQAIWKQCQTELKSIDDEYDSELARLNQQLTDATNSYLEGVRGFATNSALLMTITDPIKQQINDLTTQHDDAVNALHARCSADEMRRMSELLYPFSSLSP